MRQTKQRRLKESQLQTRASTMSSASVQPCSLASSWATWPIFGVVRNASKENSTNSGSSALLAPAGRSKKAIRLWKLDRSSEFAHLSRTRTPPSDNATLPQYCCLGYQQIPRARRRGEISSQNSHFVCSSKQNDQNIV